MDISIDKIRSLILEARRIDVKEGDTDPDSGSNPIDDGEIDVLSVIRAWTRAGSTGPRPSCAA